MESTVTTAQLRRSGEVPEQYELSTLDSGVPQSGQQTPTASATYSAASSQAALQAALDDGLNVQELAPLDRGVKAWTFCASAFAVEMMIWGYCFRFVLVSDCTVVWHHSPFCLSVTVFSKVYRCLESACMAH